MFLRDKLLPFVDDNFCASAFVDAALTCEGGLNLPPELRAGTDVSSPTAYGTASSKFPLCDDVGTILSSHVKVESLITKRVLNTSLVLSRKI